MQPLTAARMAFVAVLTVGCGQAPEPDPEPARERIERSQAAAVDPHEGHDTTAIAAADSHAQHAAAASGPPARAADAHAGHSPPTGAAPAPSMDDHAGHAAVRATAAAPAADAHAGHMPAAAQQRTPSDDGHSKLMQLVRGLLADSVVRRRVQADSGLRRLWGDTAVRAHILGETSR